jgi:hypothetical protein
MITTAPWPEELEDLCKRARFRDWSFRIEVSNSHDDGKVSGPRLVIYVPSTDGYHPEEKRTTSFHFPIPAATYGRSSWQRWLYEQVQNVYLHENGEHLHFVYERPDAEGNLVEVAERPFAPLHGDGWNPHTFYEVGIPYSEARVPQGYMHKYYPEKLYKGRYPGYWWDGETIHSDEEHDAHDQPCVPVQKLSG